MSKTTTTIDCRTVLTPYDGMEWICKVLGLNRQTVKGFSLLFDAFDDADTPACLGLHIYGHEDLDKEDWDKMMSKIWSALSSVVSDD